MMIFEIPPFLEHLTGGATIQQVEGRTVGECLTDFVRKFPRAKKLLFNDQEKLLGHIEIYVNGMSTFPEELEKTVKESDRISMLYLIVGG